MPRLSVLMPAYNAEETIARAARSTLSALPEDAQLCVLDDASQDNTLEVLQRIARTDKRLVVLSATRNSGVAATLNRLLQSTQSQYIARMDADDAVLPWRFRTALGLLERRRTDAVFTTVVHMGPGRRVLPSAPLPISSQAMSTALLLQNPVAHSTMVARRDVVEAAGGYRTVPSEDYDLWLRLAGLGYRMCRLAVPGIMYRHHDSQVTAGSEWARQATLNRETAAAHSNLSVLELGRDFGVYELLRRRTVSAAEAGVLHDFLQRIKEHSARLRTSDRALILRFCAAVQKARLS